MRTEFNSNRLMASNIHRLITLTVLILLNALFMGAYGQLVGHPSVLPPKGGFKIDGVLRANTGVPGSDISTHLGGDWVPRLDNQTFTAGVDSFVLNSAGVPKDTVTTRLKKDLFHSNSDSVFAQGSKFNDYISSLHWTTGSAPDKNDINNGLFHASGDPGTGNQWIFIAGDRLAVNGTSYIDFEFLQAKITMNSNGTFTGAGPDGGRTNGDIDISMEYNNGGSAPKVVIYRWKKLSGASSFAWDSTGSAGITDAFAQTNLTPVDVPFGAFDAYTYQPFAFVEAAINITQLINAGNVGTNCGGINIQTLWIKTKASSVSTAALKDFMSPISVDLHFGGVSIDQKGPVCANGDSITLTGSPSGGTFSGPGVTGDIFYPAVAGAGSHRIIYTATVGTNCTRSDTMYIKVNPVPGAAIAGTTSICKNGTAPYVVFTGSGGIRPYTFSYTLNAGSTKTKTTTGSYDTVRITAPTDSVGTFTYALTGVSDSSCTNTATGSAVITVLPLPTASAGTAPAAQCYNAAGNTFYPSGSGTNGTASWEVQTNSNALNVEITNSLTFTPTVKISGSSSGGSVTLRLTVTSNSTPACGTATSDVTLTVNAQQSGPGVDYIAPLCDENTFSITVNGLKENDIVTVLDKNGDAIGTLSPSSPYTVPAATTSKTFSGIPAGYGYRVTLETGGCVSLPTSCVSATRTVKVTDQPVKSLGEAGSSLQVYAYPNPFNDWVRFVVNAPESGNGSLDVYTILGQKLRNVYEGPINKGSQVFELNLPAQRGSTLVYVLRMGNKQVSGKLVQAGN